MATVAHNQDTRRFSVGQTLRVISNASETDPGMKHYYEMGDVVEVIAVRPVRDYSPKHYALRRLSDGKDQTLSDWQVETILTTSGKTIKELMA